MAMMGRSCVVVVESKVGLRDIDTEVEYFKAE